MALANEPNRARSQALARERDRFVETSLNPLLVRALKETWAGLRALEFASYRSMVEELSDLPLGSLAATTGRFLAETEEMYADVLSSTAKTRLGIAVKDLERHDLAFVARAPEHDGLFPVTAMVERVLGFVEPSFFASGILFNSSVPEYRGMMPPDIFLSTFIEKVPPVKTIRIFFFSAISKLFLLKIRLKIKLILRKYRLMNVI